MPSWQDLEQSNPQLAAHGRRMFLLGKEHGSFEAGLAYLATVRADGGPRIHPIAPALLDGHLYAFVLRNTPKARDLERDSRFALHSFPHAMEEDTFNDEEFYITGTATPADNAALCETVAKACGDAPEMGRVWELHPERVMHKQRIRGKAQYHKWRFPTDTSSQTP
jgi:hypothetical protein